MIAGQISCSWLVFPVLRTVTVRVSSATVAVSLCVDCGEIVLPSEQANGSVLRICAAWLWVNISSSITYTWMCGVLDVNYQYVIKDGTGNIDGRQGMKLGQEGVELLECCKDEEEACKRGGQSSSCLYH